MSDEIFIGVDLGTTTVKAGAFAADGRSLAVASRDFQLASPAPGQLEFDADRYIALAFDCIREVLNKPGVRAADAKAIGLSSQAQTFVMLDEKGRPVRPAVSWLDVRAGEEARELSAMARKLGVDGIGAIESGPKLLWLRRHEPESFARARRVLIIPDYFIYRLTGRAVSDPASSASTGLYDIETGLWRGPLMEACGLKTDMMSEVLFAGDSAGRLTPGASRELALGKDVLVAVGTNDQLVGAVGAGNVTPGCASATLGTALAIVLTGRKAEAGSPGTMGRGLHPARGLVFVLAFAKTSGIVLRWFRDNFAPGSSYEQLFEEVASAPIGAEGLACLPHFAGTATPTFNPAVRGAFSGLTLTHTRSHLARAVVESLTFTIRENMDYLTRAAGPLSNLRAIGGGARSDVWLQMIADATGVVVERPATTEAACKGAAILAMAASGRFSSVEKGALELYRVDRRFEPDGARRGEYDEAFKRYQALYEKLYGGNPTSL